MRNRSVFMLGVAALALCALAAEGFTQENNGAAPANNTAVPAAENSAATAPENSSAPAEQPANNAGGSAQPAPSGGAADASAGVPPPALPMKHVKWSFEGPFGMYDRAALQRGFQVYKEVCSACHSLKRVAFRNLGDPGGPGFSEAQVKAIAAGFKVSAEPDDQGRTYDDSGQRITRPGAPADYFPAPYENDKAARAANNGALPPDLSVIIKAREGGPNYVYSIQTGFNQPVPGSMHMQPNMNYNPYFPGWQIAMAPPLSDGVVTYADGTNATVDRMAHDVATFLTWAADPKMEERKELGFGVTIFMLVLSGLLYLSYRKVWGDAH